MDSLASLLGIDRLTHIVDIGANPIDGDPPYKSMLDAGLCRITGFEPQQEAMQQLLAAKGELETYLPYAVGDGQRHTLNICRASGMTSLLEPDERTLSLFEVLKPLAEVIARTEVDTVRLDDIEELLPFDVLKIDIQGTELDVFRNGKDRLKGAVAVHVEVSFVTLYRNQPGFGEVDFELRAQGFMPHCFAAVKKWPISPCVVNGNPREPLHQLLEADMVYVRNIAEPDGISSEQLKHLALVAYACYGSVDLTLRCIMLLEQRGDLPQGQQRFIELLQGQAPQ